MTKTLALAALAAALALPAAAAISPETYKADLQGSALQKGDMLPVNGDIHDGAIVIGYQTGVDSITLFRVPLLTLASR